MATLKIDELLNRMIDDIAKKQLDLGNSACDLSIKTMSSVLRIEKSVQKTPITDDKEAIKIFNSLESRISSSATMSIKSYERAVGQFSLLRETSDTTEKQKLLSNIVRDVKLTIVSQDISSESFSLYLKTITPIIKTFIEKRKID